MNLSEERLRRALVDRDANFSLRTLARENGLIDFCSNDYLGFSRSGILLEKIRQKSCEYPEARVGSTGSRLISGNSQFCEELESRIAKYHHAEAGLIFNSGYDANLGIFSSVPQRADTIIYDQLAHASIRDGIRLSYARSFSFRHNDIEDLSRKLKSATGNIFVAVESIYSMDGDCAPLSEMSELCCKCGASLIVDEAHATGVFGERGAGKVVELGLENKIFARLHTFGKALGCHGAAIVGSETLRSYLINFARSFIYTTALPFHSLLSISCAYDLLSSNGGSQAKLKNRISYFKKELGRRMIPNDRMRINESDSAIQCIIIPGNENARTAACRLQEAGFDVRPILHPTVPVGAERLRICVHAFNTETEIGRFVEAMNNNLFA